MELKLRNLRDEFARYAQMAEGLHDRGLFGLLLIRQGALPRLVSLACELDDLNQHQPKPEQLTLSYVKLRHTLPGLVYELNRLLRLYLAPEAGYSPVSNLMRWDGQLERRQLDFLVQAVRKAEQQQQPEPGLYDQDPYYLDLPYKNQVYELSQKCRHSIAELNATHRSIADIILVLCSHVERLDILVPPTFEQECDVLEQSQMEWCQQNAEAMQRWRAKLEYELTGDISLEAKPEQWQEAYGKIRRGWQEEKNDQIFQFLLNYEYPGNAYSLRSRDIVSAIIRLLVDEDIDMGELFSQMERYNTVVRIIRRGSTLPDPNQRFRQEVLSIARKAREYWDDDKAPVQTFDLIWNDWLDDPRILSLMHTQSPANIGLDLNLKLILNLTGILLQRTLIRVAQTKLSKEMHPDGKRADSYITGYEQFGSKDSELTQPLLDFANKVVTSRLSAKK